MKNVTWIIESNVFAETCFDDMVAHLKENDMAHHIVRIIPFIHEIDGKVPDVTGPVVVYGSIGVQKLAATHGWLPGVFPVPTEIEAQRGLGDLYLNHDITRMKISAVATYLADSYKGGNTVFIKPDTDTKEFAGQVIDALAFNTWYAGMLDSGYLADNDFDVVVSSPKKLGCEWRVVVADGKIVTSSLYRQYQMVKAERNIIPEVEAVVMEAHRRYPVQGAYVIDIAQAGDDYKVIEYNCVNSAGLYDCDARAFIDAVTAFVEETYAE